MPQGADESALEAEPEAEVVITADAEAEPVLTTDGADDVGMPHPESAAAAEIIASADLDLEQLRELDRHDFALWCGRLFERFGYVVKIMEEAEQSGCDLKVTRNDEVVAIDCRLCDEGHSVTRTQCQTLIGAMVGGQIKRGIIIATGAFDPGCADYAENLQGLHLEFIDGNELVEAHRAMSTPPLARFFGLAG